MSQGKTSDAMKMWTRDIERAIRAHADHINPGANHDADEFELDPEYAGAKRYMDRMNELFGEDLSTRASRMHIDRLEASLRDSPLPPASPWKEADARCARCSEGENIGEVVAEMDEALIAYAARELSGDPIWQQLHAVRQAMVATI